MGIDTPLFGNLEINWCNENEYCPWWALIQTIGNACNYCNSMKMNIAPDGHWYYRSVSMQHLPPFMKMNIAPDGHWYQIPCFFHERYAWMKMNIAPDGHWYCSATRTKRVSLTMKMNIAPDGHWYIQCGHNLLCHMKMNIAPDGHWYKVAFTFNIIFSMKMNIAPDGHWYSPLSWQSQGTPRDENEYCPWWALILCVKHINSSLNYENEYCPWWALIHTLDMLQLMTIMKMNIAPDGHWYKIVPILG